eukprot:GHVS01014516.1.p1 GENE.GHVS01014516.1~~GHVS01014516.1.p1  ORF type:complete len:474 (+),score=55.01 GHVS01014516.1:194-1615(+)
MNSVRVRHLENALIQFDSLSVIGGEGLPSVWRPHPPLDLFLRHYFSAHRKRLSSPDKAWVSANLYEMIRWRGLLDYVCPSPVNWSNRLRTFAISDRWRAHSMNLRLAPHIRCSFPEFLFQRLEKHFGTAKSILLCNILNEAPPMFLRVNVLRGVSRDRIYKYMCTKQVQVEKSVHSPFALMLTETQKLLDLPEYKQGLIEIQDEGSQLVGCKIQCKPGDKVLDYCAGSGGKSLVFGIGMENTGKIYLHDTRTTMLQQARKRLRNAGIKNYHILPPEDPLHRRLKGKMDWVVVDAPCSSTATLRRNPDLKWNLTDQRLCDLVLLQREIFKKALEYVKPVSGRIVYSTSSILDEENVQQVKYFCEVHGLVLSSSPFHALPQSKAMDGFFLAIFERLQTNPTTGKLNRDKKTECRTRAAEVVEVRKPDQDKKTECRTRAAEVVEVRKPDQEDSKARGKLQQSAIQTLENLWKTENI